MAIESGCQNGQLGCAILKVAFPNHLIGSFFIFPLLYSVFQLTEGLILVAIFRYRNRQRSGDDDKKEDSRFFQGVHAIRTVSLHVIDKMRERSRRSGTAGDCEKPVIPEESTDASTECKGEFSSSGPEISDELASSESGVSNPAFEFDCNDRTE